MKLGCPCWEVVPPKRRQSWRKSPRLEEGERIGRKAPSRRTRVCLPSAPGCACPAVPACCARVYRQGVCPAVPARVYLPVVPAGCARVLPARAAVCASLVCPGVPAQVYPLPGAPGCTCLLCPAVPARVCPGVPARLPGCASLVCPCVPPWWAQLCLPELPTHTQLRRDSESDIFGICSTDLQYFINPMN